MQLTKGAIGNLINRYTAVLKKCRLMNTFGSLAVAGMLVMGGAGVAGAEGSWTKPNGETAQWTNGVVPNGTVLQGTYEGFSQEEETLAGVATVDYTTTGVSVANGTTFTNNSKTAGAAGALKLLNGIKIGDNVTFTDNKATGPAWGGGAIYIKLTNGTNPSESQQVSIGSNAKFANNQAQTWGGAIALEYGNLTIDEGAIFEGNKTLGKNGNGEEGGGAIAVWHDPSNGEPGKTSLSVTKATFKQNSTNVSGGAIYNKDGNITITGSQFDQNSSGSMGGAIANMSGKTDYTGEINITDSGFTGNTAGNGGAVWNGTNGKVNITNSTFSKNTAMLKDHSLQQGGAITNGGEMTITGSTFEDNTANKRGGAIFNSGTLTVNGGSFDGHKAGNGGAIYNATNATLKITGTSFTNNTAAGWGGAILNSGATITVTDATFANNIAQGGAGGAIGNPAEGTSSVTVSGTKFLNNHSVYDGGAIGNYGGMKIENCLFEGNTAQLAFDEEKGTWTKPVTDNTAVGGGAISLGAVSNSAVASISGTTFKNNTSGTNGGAIATRQAIHADNSAAKLDIAATFIGNKAQQGGAIYNSFYTDNGLGKGAGVTVTGTFSGNEATSKGGAIYNDGTLDKNSTKPSGGVMTITDATFDNNKADFGGAIFNTGTLTINGGGFEGNTAKSAAGAIYNAADAMLTVDGVTFANNSSAIAGAINNRDGDVTITDSTFTGNDAGKSMGGAIRNDSGDTTKDGTITITGSTFEGNKAGNGGAVWNGFDGTVNITGSTFKGNTAVAGIGQGGAITNADEMTITGSTFEGNQAGKLGGAIFNAANGKLTFNGTNTFTNNTAAGNTNDIYNAGTITVAGGTTTLNSGLILAAGSQTDVSGGALVINGTTTWEKGADATAELGSLTVNGGALTLQKGDVLVSNADQLSVKDDISLSVKDDSSLYLINKENYTAKDFTAAKDALGDVLATDASFGFVGGQLVDDDGKVTDLVVSGNEISGETKFETDGLENTKVDNSSFLENDLTVKADDKAEVTISGADVAVNKVNIETSATGDKSLTINNNGSLTVVGGNANDLLIAANDKALTTIKVDSGELNLGSAAMPERGAGTLGEAHITLGNNGSLNASNGDYTVGDVTGTGKVTANTGANLNTGNINVLAVTADAANIKATGDVMAGDIDLVKGGSVTSDKNITVNGSIEAADGTLQAGGDITVQNDITKAGNGKLTVVAGDTIEATGITATNVAAKKLTVSGDVAVDGGVLNLTGTDTDASTVDSLKLTNGTQATVADLKLDGANKTLTVGTGDDTVGGTTLSAKHIDLNGGMLLVDPAWGLASSNVAVESLSAGSVGVGRNSYLALGTADTGWLPGVVGNYTKGVGLSETGITAALGVFKGIEIADGKNLTVDGSKTGTEINTGWTSSGATNSAEFANNSLLVVNGANIYGDKAAIKFAAASGGTLTVAEGAKLVVTDAVAGQDYTIVANAATVQDGTSAPITDGGTVWKTEGLSTTTDMISLGDAKYDATDKKVTTSAVRNDAHTVFPNLSDGMANAVNDLYTGHAGAAGQPNWDYADVNSDQMGVRFLSRATDNRFLGMDKNAAAESIESAARIAFAGAAPQMTRMASDAATNAVVNRLGFANPVDGLQAIDAEGKIVDRNTTGFALWIAPLWQSQNGWGLEADIMDYGFNGNLGGVSLGADYTFENALRAGITFNIGGGYAESSGGDLSSTENRMNFWGLGAYAGWNYENFGVMADVSYTSTWNQLKQDLDSRLGMGNELEADVQATAISAGLRAEYLLKTSALDIIPHIGVRYMSLNTWGYDVEANGGNVLEGDSLHQDIWTFPIGVTFSKEFATDSGWNFKPSLDFTVIPAAGDIEARHDVRFTGLPGTYEVETRMMDYLTWQGGVGLELANDNMSIGVNYTLQAGQHTTGHGVFGSFRYEF